MNLFKPLLYLEGTKDSTHDAIQRLLVKHAEEGLALLIRFCQAYGASYLHPILLFCLVHLCDAIITHDRASPSALQTIRFCIETLEEAKAGYPLARSLQQMFATAVGDCNLQLPPDLQGFIADEPSMYQLEKLLNAVTRPTYQAPISLLLPNLRPGLAQEFMDAWQRASATMDGDSRSEVESTQPQRSMQISLLLNED